MKSNSDECCGVTSKVYFTQCFRFTEKTYRLDEHIPPHEHKLAFYCLVISGEFTETIGNKTFERKPGTLICYPQGVKHFRKQLTSGRCLLVDVVPEEFKSFYEFRLDRGDTGFLGTEMSLRLATRIYKEFSEHDHLTWMALDCMMTELVITTSRQSESIIEKKPPEWLNTVTQFLHQNFSKSVGLKELAKIAGVHATQIARVFRQFKGCTAGDYVKRIRIDDARQQLISTENSIAEISRNTGFADQSHFARAFKDAAGITPTEFRRLFDPQ